MPRGRPAPVSDGRRWCLIAGDLWVRWPTTMVPYRPATDSARAGDAWRRPAAVN
jgi:hypothetical protein